MRCGALANNWRRGSGIVLCLALIAFGCGQKQNQFSFDNQVGMVVLRDATVGCLTVYNTALKPGTRVVVVVQPNFTDDDDKPDVLEATIEEVVQDECDNHIDLGDRDGVGLSFYGLRPVGRDWPEWVPPSVGVVDPAGPVTLVDGKIDADLDNDGTKECFRMCMSSEGAHYQVWTGEPLSGQPRFHWYFYAGYDTEVTCTEKEYFGPK